MAVCKRAKIVFTDAMISDWCDIYKQAGKVWMHPGDAQRIQETGHDVAIRQSRGVGTGFERLKLDLPSEEIEYVTKRLQRIYNEVHEAAIIYFPTEPASVVGPGVS